MLLTLAMLVSMCSILPIAYATQSQYTNAEPKMGTIEEIISSYYDPNGRPMSCAHRAITSIKNNPIPENSLVAIQACIDAKVDIVELDIMRTKDGVYVLCHDDTIKRTTTYTGSKKISDMTYEDVLKYPLLQYTGGSASTYYDANGKTVKIPTLEDALKLCKDKCMINLDKFDGQWDNRMEIYELVRKNGCLDNVMFKSGTGRDVLAWHNEIRREYGSDAKMPNYCYLYSNGNGNTYVNKLKEFHDNKVAFAVETGFSYSNDLVNPEVLAQARKYVRPFANVLYESLGGTYGGQNLENSTGWAEVIGMGYNILHTNNSADLAAYIYANYAPGAKDPDNGIEVRYFNDFIRNKTPATEGAPRSSIELTSGGVKLYGGNYIAFHDIDLSSTLDEYFLTNIINVSGSGTLSIRLDSPTGPVLAQYSVSSAGIKSFELTQDSYGTRDIYVCLDSISSNGYVTVGRMSTAKHTSGNAAYISKASVFTRPGVAPNLPTSVTVTTEYGNEYTANVKWNDIPSACYSTNMTYFKVAGVLQSTCEVVYATVTVLDLDMTDASLWFDASTQIITDADSNVVAWYDRISGIKATGPLANAPKFVDSTGDYISFDGSNDYLKYTHSINGASKLTLVINTITPNKSTDYYNSYAIGNAVRYTLLQYPESGSWGGVWLTSFKNGITCRFGSGTENRGMYYNQLSLSDWNMIAATKNGTSEKLYANGSVVYNRADDTGKTYCTGNTAEQVKNTSNEAQIGYGVQSSNYYYKGSVSDIIVFKRDLSQSELSLLNTYLKAKMNETLVDTTYASMCGLPSYVHTLDCTAADDLQHNTVCSVCGETVTTNHSFAAQNPNNGKLSTGACTECGHSEGKNFAGFIQFANSKDYGHLLRILMVVDAEYIEDPEFDTFNMVITIDGRTATINSQQLTAYDSVSAAGINCAASEGYYIFGAVIMFPEFPQEIHVELTPVTDGVADTSAKLFEGSASASSVDVPKFTVDTANGKFSEYNWNDLVS